MTQDGLPISSLDSSTAVIDHPAAHAPLAFLSREQILRATAHCLAHEGYDGTTIRRIVAELNCAVGSIYRYFRDKRELLSAVTQDRFVPVVDAIDSGAPLDQTLALYHEIATADPVAYRLMFWLASMQASAVPTARAAQDGAAVPDVVEQIIDGWARQLDDRRAAEQHWIMAHGSIILHRPTAGDLSRRATNNPQPSRASLPPSTPVVIEVPQEPAAPPPPRAEPALQRSPVAHDPDEEDLCLL
ncbi:MAG: TetR/AcrR family transcriptional regulator [Phycisphaeraceae bacterium]